MDGNKLTELFDLLCDDFKKLLEKEDGMTAADRKLLIEFLKDNNVTCVGMNNKNITSIVDKMPFPEDKRAINQ